MTIEEDTSKWDKDMTDEARKDYQDKARQLLEDAFKNNHPWMLGTILNAPEDGKPFENGFPVHTEIKGFATIEHMIAIANAIVHKIEHVKEKDDLVSVLETIFGKGSVRVLDENTDFENLKIPGLEDYKPGDEVQVEIADDSAYAGDIEDMSGVPSFSRPDVPRPVAGQELSAVELEAQASDNDLAEQRRRDRASDELD